jgi:hypothetical protein
MPPPEPIPDLLKAVNDSSARGFGLWVTFLTVGAYLAIAIGTTTHLQLLLEAPVKLPLLGVDLPLFAFYLFAPPLFLLLHFNVLTQRCMPSRNRIEHDADLPRATPAPVALSGTPQLAPRGIRYSAIPARRPRVSPAAPAMCRPHPAAAAPPRPPRCAAPGSPARWGSSRRPKHWFRSRPGCWATESRPPGPARTARIPPPGRASK